MRLRARTAQYGEYRSLVAAHGDDDDDDAASAAGDCARRARIADAADAHAPPRPPPSPPQVRQDEQRQEQQGDSADAVRWCEPYADDILRYHERHQRCTSRASSRVVGEHDRRILVNWMCDATRRVQYRSETFWTAVCTFDRYMATVADDGVVERHNHRPMQRRRERAPLRRAATFERDDDDDDDDGDNDLQCIAAACVHLAASVQETADAPRIGDVALACGHRYEEARLRAMCWRIVRALQADLQCASPLTFYRHYSRAMRQTAREHTMTKFVVETLAFAHDALLTRYEPSALAAAALLAARCATYCCIPDGAWLRQWRLQCPSSVDCAVDVCAWLSVVLDAHRSVRSSASSNAVDSGSDARAARAAVGGARGVDNDACVRFDIAPATSVRHLDSVVRRYAHNELFAVSQCARLPTSAAARLRLALCAA